MTLTRRVFAAAAVAGLVAGPALAADGPEMIAAKKLYPFLDLYLSLPAANRSRFMMAYYLRSNGKPVTGDALTLISAGGGRSTIPLGDDGRLLKLPSPADLKDGQVAIARPSAATRFQLNMEMQPVLRLAEIVSADEAAAAIAQCRTAIKAKAGIIGFAAPKIEQVIFAGVTSGTAVFSDGRTAPLPLYRNMPAYDPAVLADVASLKFARAPARALLVGKK
ncbi:MAG: hypothetical protein Q8L66_13675 [Caulobacter sp.]|nr:hypothetical protein [Caulobacter sp.]